MNSFKHLFEDFILTDTSLTLIVVENGVIIKKDITFDRYRFIANVYESILFFNIKQLSYFTIDFIVTESNKRRIKSLMTQLRFKFPV
jgi:hypothetical protein